MNDPLKMLLEYQQKHNLFPTNSRYYGTETATLETTGKGKTVYLKRRFVPSPDSFVVIREYTVTQEERLDNIAAQQLGDPELFWRICDANDALHPNEITAAVGRVLKITLPEGVPG